MKEETMLSTIDNPYNYFTQFNEWLSFDIEKGYNCCSLLARFARISDQFSEEENNAEIERAIDEIIKYDPLNIYTKITRNETIIPQKVDSYQVD